VIRAGGDVFVASGYVANTNITSGGSLVVGSAGQAGYTKIAGGQLEMTGNAKILGTVSFTAPDGQFIIDSPNAPTAVISGFAAGDQISFAQLTYSAGDTVSVTKPGIVTVSAGGQVYNLHIAGAVVSSTAFHLGSGEYGLELTTGATGAAPAAMAFIAPAVTSSAATPSALPGYDFTGGGLSSPLGAAILANFATSEASLAAAAPSFALAGIMALETPGSASLVHVVLPIDK
jgi:hypothetical protein